MKVCIVCKEEKDDKEFSLRSGKSKYFWRSSICKSCAAKNQKEIREKRKTLGLCSQCGKPTNTDKKHCKSCMDQDVELHRRRKKSAVEYLGGRCKICGLTSDFMSIYDFHHRDPDTKRFGIGVITRRSWDLVLAELNKCDLLCSNCHRILHEKLARGEI